MVNYGRSIFKEVYASSHRTQGIVVGDKWGRNKKIEGMREERVQFKSIVTIVTIQSIVKIKRSKPTQFNMNTYC